MSETKNPKKSFWDVIFFPIYVVILFFVKVGELTQFLFFLPIRLVSSFSRWVSQTIKKTGKVLLKKKSQKTQKSFYTWRVRGPHLKEITKTSKHVTFGFIKYILIALIIIFSFVLRALFFFIRVLGVIFYFLIVIPIRAIPIRLKYFSIGFFVCLTIFLSWTAYQFALSLPSPQRIGKSNFPLSSHIFDRNGKLLYEIYRDQNRTPIQLSQIPKYVYQSSIAIEDKDFFRHKGVSWVSGIFRALKETFVNKKLQGGSTLTQQLVKSALLTPERTVERKIKEMVLAMWAERIYSKEQILEMYLNQVPYGGSSYGIEEASKTYFGKEAKKLTLTEAALLAGLPQAPSTYSPFVNPDLAKQRRNEVLQKMWEQRYISFKQKEEAQREKITILPLKTLIQAPHFVFYLKSELEEQYGVQQVEEGGFRVESSLDLAIQEESERILREELEKVAYLHVTNGAILVTRPNTGEILAMVGSANYYAVPSGAFNVTTGLRQPGSSIKPLMYALAFEKGYTPAHVLDDSPIVFQIAGSEAYRPVNYDGKFHGKVTIRYALANSFNIPAVRLLNSIGVGDFIRQAERMGISTWNDRSRYGLSLTLGGGEVTMTDMATAFGVFANGGMRVNLTGVRKIDSYDGSVSRELSSEKRRVLSEGSAYLISDILSDNVARQMAFGTRSALEIPGYQVAVKTGTTDNKKDNWTIGYTPDYLVVVWVGNNDGTPMNPYLASGITGAAPIWNRVMTYLLKNKGTKPAWFARPSDIVEKKCYMNRSEYFIKGTEQTVTCRENLFGATPSPTP